ncbi:MAG: ATP-binding protein [Methanoregulaceae archaeon]
MICTECLSLLDMLPVGLVILKKDFSIRFWNRRLEEWTGIRKDEILGKNLLREFPTLNQPAITARFPQVFSGGTPVYFSSKFHPNLIPCSLPDGTVRVQKGSVLPVQWGNDIHAMLVIEDVTDLVHQVSGFRKMRDIARQELVERKSAEDALRVANAKLSLFSDITIQDIRNQLTAARGFNYLIGHSLEDIAGIRSVAGNIDRQLGIIEKYVSLMLDFEQLGKEPPRWYSLEEVISQAKVQAQFFQVDAGPEIRGLEIYCPPLLERIVVNLFENARQHGKPDARVKISFCPGADTGIIRVEDDGAGVPPEEKEQIFGKGLGTKTRLGLYHTREILAITGIAIRETGESGKGARFEIVVPRAGYRNHSGASHTGSGEPE